MILTENSTENERIIKTQFYIMILFDNCLFLETTSNTVNIMYLSYK